MRPLPPTLPLTPLSCALAPEAARSSRTIDGKLSRYACSPERIEVRLGEQVWLNIVRRTRQRS